MNSGKWRGDGQALAWFPSAHCSVWVSVCFPRICPLISAPNIYPHCSHHLLSHHLPHAALIESSWEGELLLRVLCSVYSSFYGTWSLLYSGIYPLIFFDQFSHHILYPMIEIHIWKFKNRTLTVSCSLHSFYNAMLLMDGAQPSGARGKKEKFKN